MLSTRHAVALAALMTAGCGQIANLITGDPDAPAPTPQLTETHRAMAGKVVFSKTEAPPDPGDASAFTDRFTLGEPIHVRAFTDDSLWNRMPEMRPTFRGYSSTGVYFTLQIGDMPLERGLPVGAVGLSQAEARTLASFAPAVPLTAIGRFATKAVDRLVEGDNALIVRAYFQPSASLGNRPYEKDGVLIAEGAVTLAATREGLIQIAEAGTEPFEGRVHPERSRVTALFRKDFEAWRSGKKAQMVIVDIVPLDGWTVVTSPVHGRPTARYQRAAIQYRSDDWCYAKVFSREHAYTGLGDTFAEESQFGWFDNTAREWPCLLPLRLQDP